MERTSIPLSDERSARFEVLVDELLPPLRALSPFLPDETLLELAVHVAAYRLADTRFVWAEP
jgi:hypothetical protein